jgi:hypothetical protein
MSYHRESNVTMPAMPVSHFILVKSCFSLTFFKALLDGVSSGGHFSKPGKGNLLGSKTQKGAIAQGNRMTL